MIRFRKKNDVLYEVPDNNHQDVLSLLHVDCECGEADHTFRFSYVLDDEKEYIEDELYLECILCDDDFWFRLKTAFLYVFNFKNVHRWKSILITVNDARKIKELCELYLRSNAEIKKIVSK